MEFWDDVKFSCLICLSSSVTRIFLTLEYAGVSGAQADDSIILQFLLDWREMNDVRASCTNQVDLSGLKLPKKETKANEENVSRSLTIRQQIATSMKSNEAEKLWVSWFWFSLTKTHPCISSWLRFQLGILNQVLKR